jgi:hypothetical protein
MGSKKNKNKKDTKITDTKLQTAWDLYNKTKSEVFDNSFPDPEHWIHNKEKMVGCNMLKKLIATISLD